MSVSFLLDKTTKLSPQRIMVKSSEVSKPPLLAKSSIGKDKSLLKSFVKERFTDTNSETENRKLYDLAPNL